MVSAALVLQMAFFTTQLIIFRSEGSSLNEHHRTQELQNKVSELLATLRKIKQETQAFVSQCRRERNRQLIEFPTSYSTTTEEYQSSTHIFYGKSRIE